MSLLSYKELVRLVKKGVITAKKENINGASIDITLHDVIRVEEKPAEYNRVVSIANKENIETKEICIKDGYILKSNEFILASSNEIFNLPGDIAAEYVLKSSMARNGLNHMLAGFCDPHWFNSRLTLELKNETNYHELLLMPDMKIGQVKFFRVKDVPVKHGYSKKGQYNNQEKVQESKGIK